jgi:hypothetical protein
MMGEGKTGAIQSMPRAVNALKIITICIGATTLYGTVQALIAEQLSPQLFTQWLPEVFKSPTVSLPGYVWGMAGSWWVGLIVGCVLAASMNMGNLPNFAANSVVRPLLFILATTALNAACIGASVFYFFSGAIVLRVFGIDASHIDGCLCVANIFAVIASYVIFIICSSILCHWMWQKRRRGGWASTLSN